METDDRPAAQVYELRVTEQDGKTKKGLRWFFVVVQNIISEGMGGTTTGGRLVEIVDVETQVTVKSFTEEIGDMYPSSVEQLEADIAKMTASAFAQRWWEY